MRLVSVVVKAHPRRKTTVLSVESDDSLVVSVAAPRIEGKANKLLIAVLADYFHVSPAQVSIVKGHLSTHKLVQIL